MPDRSPLAPLTALGARDACAGQIGQIRLTEQPQIALASLAARLGEAPAEALPGLALPGPGRHTTGPDGSGALWLGPQTWLIEAPLGTPPDLTARLKAHHGAAASVTDQTDAWVCFEIQAPDAAPLLERLAMLDPHIMDAGHGSRTVIDHIGCLVICREVGRRFSILGPRSSAGSLHHALTAAAHALIGLEAAA